MRNLEARLRRLEPKLGELDMIGATFVWRDQGQSEADALKIRFGDAEPPAKIVFMGWLPAEDGGERLEVPAPVIDEVLRETARRGRPRPGVRYQAPNGDTLDIVTGVPRSPDFGK